MAQTILGCMLAYYDIIIQIKSSWDSKAPSSPQEIFAAAENEWKWNFEPADK